MTDGDPHDDTKTAFAPVIRSERLVDKVVSALNQSIVSGRLDAGDFLPSERELCEQFKVSRPVIREAIGSLSAKGLLESSPNRGHVVTALGRATVTESLTLYLRGQRLDYHQLMDVRKVIEVENAGLAAVRATDAQITSMRELVAAMDGLTDPEALSAADIEFHFAIAAATGNEFFGVVLDSIREVLHVAQLPALSDEALVNRMRRGHKRVLRAIAARDETGSREAMQTHLREAERGMRSVARATPAEPTY